MLNRLPELRKAAKLPPDEKPPVSSNSLEESVVLSLASDERSVRAICADIRVKVAELRRIGKEVREAVLPARLQELRHQQEATDAACQQLVRQSKELLLDLADAEKDQERAANYGFENFVAKFRENAAIYWKDRVKEVVLEFFAVRGSLNDDVRLQQRRRLRLAYPEADEETLQLALVSPEVAARALARRLDVGDDMPLRTVLNAADSVEDRQIEEAAKNLKLIFLQFAELIDMQGETLNEIEAKIDSTIEHIEEAKKQLEDARATKSKNWRQAVKYKMCGCCCCFMFVAMIWSWLWAKIQPVLSLFGIFIPDWHLDTSHWLPKWRPDLNPLHWQLHLPHLPDVKKWRIPWHLQISGGKNASDSRSASSGKESQKKAMVSMGGETAFSQRPLQSVEDGDDAELRQRSSLRQARGFSRMRKRGATMHAESFLWRGIATPEEKWRLDQQALPNVPSAAKAATPVASRKGGKASRLFHLAGAAAPRVVVTPLAPGAPARTLA